MYTNFGAVIRITTDVNSYINLSLLGAKMIYSPQYILGAEKIYYIGGSMGKIVLESGKRLSNIELLRIVAMLMVILGHYYVHGGIPEEAGLGVTKTVFQFLGSGSKIAVNIFVIISGYFLVTQKFNWMKVIRFLSCTYFWSLAIVVFSLFAFGASNVDSTLMKKSLFPLTPLNWFARAYLNLYLVFPVLNIIMRKLSKGKILALIGLLTLWFYGIPTWLNESKGGYLNSLFMFSDMYLMGACIRVYGNEKLMRRLKVTGFLGMAVIWLSIVGFDYESLKDPDYTALAMSFPHSGANFFVLLVALGIFAVFKDMTVPSNGSLNKIAKTTFGVYLIHDNALIVPWLWNTVIRAYEFYGSPFLIVHMVFTATGIFFVCAVLEYLRINYIERPMMNFVSVHKNRLFLQRNS